MEKMDTGTANTKLGGAQSKRNPQKHFAPRQVNSQFRRALSNETPAKHTKHTYVTGKFLHMKTTFK
jgi:hypothetical protein